MKLINLEDDNNFLAQTFKEMLEMAESMFGSKDNSWTFIGFEYRSDGPYICYYPFKNISIVLSSECEKPPLFLPQLFYQLSHEVCHLLYPTGKQDANLLVEGISTYFSRLYLDHKYPNNTYAIRNISNSKYFEAYKLVNKLLTIDSDAIKKIRAINPAISYLSKEEFLSLNIALEEAEIDRLLDRFKY